MKFNIKSAGYFYSKKDAEELEKIGFKFGPLINLRRSKMQSPEEGFEIKTLEDLIAFSKKYGQIIVDEDEIMIYDDYIE